MLSQLVFPESPTLRIKMTSFIFQDSGTEITSSRSNVRQITALFAMISLQQSMFFSRTLKSVYVQLTRLMEFLSGKCALELSKTDMFTSGFEEVAQEEVTYVICG